MVKVNFEDIQIHPVRIPAGWTIELNKLHEVEPDPSIDLIGGPEGFSLLEVFFEQNLFRASNQKRGMLIDVGWYPEWDKEGQYELEVYSFREEADAVSNSKRKELGDKPIYSYATKSTKDLIQKMEDLLLRIAKGKF